MRRNLLAMALLAAVLAASAGHAAAQAISREFESLISLAGNTASDEARLAIMKQMQTLPELSETLKQELDSLVKEADRYLHDPKLTYFTSQVMEKDDYDFGVAQDSPLYGIAALYRARMVLWATLEHGGYWSVPEIRRERFDMVRKLFEDLREVFPDNDLVAMYLGKRFPAPRQYEPDPNAPDWANHQRAALEHLADIVTWWIEHRQQADGQYGGGWGDDCEMWRFWVPILVGFQDPRIEAAQAKFSEALWTQEHMKRGYTDRMTDVEHSSEDSADTLTPMLHLDPDSEAWKNRALHLAELMRELWTGINERGQLQYKSTYFNVDEVDPDPRKACDTVYHPRTVQPALLLWQRTNAPDLGDLFTKWLDTWVDATAREERGKPAGIIPSAIHWPDGNIGGLGEHWWDPENHNEDPLYVWPSAMGQMTQTLLLAYHMTGEEKYLEPLRTMAAARLEYLEHTPESEPEPGTRMWCGSKLSGITAVLAKYRLLTGNTEFDDLLEADPAPYMAYRMTGDLAPLEQALRGTADALSVNLEGYTSEVRYTDRVLRLPQIFGENGMYPEAQADFSNPDTNLLYASTTGDPGAADYFPLAAVRWLTPPREIAILVVEGGTTTFEALLYHFGDGPRAIEANMLLLKPGKYSLKLRAGDYEIATQEVVVDGPASRMGITLEPRILHRLELRLAAEEFRSAGGTAQQ